ncbi:hypothetical protein ACR78N_00005 [Sphingobacterium siyangense]
MDIKKKFGSASFGEDLILQALSCSPEPTSIYGVATFEWRQI